MNDLPTQDSIKKLLGKLASKKEPASRAAGEALVLLAKANPAALKTNDAFKTLTRLVNHNSYYARSGAISVLELTNPKELVETLTKNLRHKNPKISKNAIQRFAYLTQAMPEAIVKEMRRKSVAALIEAAAEKNWFIRANAIAVLGRLKAAEAIPVFIAALDDEQTYVRGDAAIALGSFGAKAAAATDALIKALDDSSNDFYAAEALGKIGAAALKAIPFLEKAAQKAFEMGDEQLPDYASAAIRRIKAAARRASAKDSKGEGVTG